MSYSLRQNPAYSGNFMIGRGGATVNEIIIHHAATTDFNGIGTTFKNPIRGVSAHYGVGSNGNVDQYVSEANTAFHAGNWNHNLRSIGIENVNLTGAPDWKIANSTFSTLVELVYDIARRYKMLPLKVGVNLRGHKDVSDRATACPLVLEPRLQELANKVNTMASEKPKPTVPDQVLRVGERFVFPKTYRVDELKNVGGIWQVRTKELCKAGFTWSDNGIPVMPLREVAGGTGNSKDQVLQVGSRYTIPGTYAVLNLGRFDGMWLAEIDMQGYKLWVDVATVREV